jgi:hypothetical protein
MGIVACEQYHYHLMMLDAEIQLLVQSQYFQDRWIEWRNKGAV